VPKGIAFCRLLADFVEKSRKSIVVANLLKYQRHLRLTFIAAADRFRTRSVESEVDDEAPASGSENRTHSVKKIEPSQYSDFFNRIGPKRHLSQCSDTVAIGGRADMAGARSK
jgi:hypothetical protein